jgi:hypothetical protein
VIEGKPEVNKLYQRDNHYLKDALKPIFWLQLIIIILLIMNMSTLNGWFGTDDADISWDRINFIRGSRENNGILYDVELSLRNVGGKSAWVYVWGELYESKDDSEPGEELIKVMEIGSNIIRSGQTKIYVLGMFKALDDYSYYMRFHISWNDKIIERVKMLPPPR